jgi:hypothetical protein
MEIGSRFARPEAAVKKWGRARKNDYNSDQLRSSHSLCHTPPWSFSYLSGPRPRSSSTQPRLQHRIGSLHRRLDMMSRWTPIIRRQQKHIPHENPLLIRHHVNRAMRARSIRRKFAAQHHFHVAQRAMPPALTRTARKVNRRVLVIAKVDSSAIRGTVDYGVASHDLDAVGQDTE